MSETEPKEEKYSNESSKDDPLEKDHSEKQNREEPVEEDASHEQSGEPFGESVSRPFSHYGGDSEHQTLNQSSSGEKKRSAEKTEVRTPKKHKLDHPSSPEQDSGPSGESIQDKHSKVITYESTPEGQQNSGSSGKRKHGKWDAVTEGNGEAPDDDVVTKRRKSSSSDDDVQLKLLGPLKLPNFAKGLGDGANADNLNSQLLEINQKLQAPEVVDDRTEKERSPSPLPIYNELGIRINTRELRLRAKLVKQRGEIISELIRKNPAFRRPSDYKPSKLYKKLYIPVKQYPGYNFVGPILGPRGFTRTRMEMETGARIVIRGIGSTKRGNTPQRDAKPIPSENEDPHVYIEADNQKSLDAAVERVEKLLVPVVGLNTHKLEQLKELAELNGGSRGKTAPEIDAPCNIGCDNGHPRYSYPFTRRLVSFKGPHVTGNASLGICPSIGTSFPHAEKSYKVIKGNMTFSYFLNTSTPGSKTEKKNDGSNLYVGYLPLDVNDDRLIELFSPFGKIKHSRVVKDRDTGLSKGYGFVNYTNPICAAKAMEHMNGHRMDGKILRVKVADGLPITSPCRVTVKPTIDRSPMKIYPGYAALNYQQHCLMDWPGPPVAGLSKNCDVPSLRFDPLTKNCASYGCPYITPVHSYPVLSNVSQPTDLVQFSDGRANIGLRRYSSSSFYSTPVSSSLISSNDAELTELAKFPGKLNKFASHYFSFPYGDTRSLYSTPFHSVIEEQCCMSNNRCTAPMESKQHWL